MQGNPSYDQFFTEIYLQRARGRKRSWPLDERLSKRHISPIFGHMPLRSITPEDVEKWLAELRLKGLAPSTCNRILAIFKSVFALASVTGHITSGHSPCRDIRNFKMPAGRERFLSREEGTRLMSCLRAVDKPESLLLQLLLLTGARKGEILRARWEYLDCERRILTVPLSKSGKTRFIYLSEEAARIFKSIKPREGSPWIFPGRNPQKPLSDIYHFWNNIRTQLGLHKVRIHDLRHSFASYLVGAGQSLYVTQQLLGHSDPRLTMRYAHFAQNTLLAATGTLDKLFGGGENLRRKKTAGGGYGAFVALIARRRKKKIVRRYVGIYQLN